MRTASLKIGRAKVSKRDLERKAKATLLMVNQVMDKLVDQLAMERLHAEIHKEVNRQAAMGEITRHELFQWRLKWDGYHHDTVSDPEKMADDLGLASLKDAYRDIYNFTSREVGDMMTALYLALETGGQQHG